MSIEVDRIAVHKDPPLGTSASTSVMECIPDSGLDVVNGGECTLNDYDNDPPSYCSSLNHVLSLKEDRSLQSSSSYLQFIKSKYTTVVRDDEDEEDHLFGSRERCYESWKVDYDLNNVAIASSVICNDGITVSTLDDDCDVMDIPLTHAQSNLDFNLGHEFSVQVVAIKCLQPWSLC